MFSDDAVNQRLCIANLYACMNLFCDCKFKEVFFKITGYTIKHGIVKEKHENMFLFKILFVILQANYQKIRESLWKKFK